MGLRKQPGHEIHGTLRPPKETGVLPIPPASIETLMQMQAGLQGMMGQPAKARQRQVEVYKGLTRDVVVLADEASAQ